MVDVAYIKLEREPILMRDRRQVIRKVIRTEFRGMFQPGWTWAIVPEKGRPLSVLKSC